MSPWPLDWYNLILEITSTAVLQNSYAANALTWSGT